MVDLVIPENIAGDILPRKIFGKVFQYVCVILENQLYQSTDYATTWYKKDLPLYGQHNLTTLAVSSTLGYGIVAIILFFQFFFLCFSIAPPYYNR